jgi:hypothetical protein
MISAEEFYRYPSPLHDYINDCWQIATMIAEKTDNNQSSFDAFAAARDIVYDEIDKAIRELGFQKLKVDRIEAPILVLRTLYMACFSVAGEEVEKLFYEKTRKN